MLIERQFRIFSFVFGQITGIPVRKYRAKPVNVLSDTPPELLAAPCSRLIAQYGGKPAIRCTSPKRRLTQSRKTEYGDPLRIDVFVRFQVIHAPA
ncbi:hypothetical protein D3C87_1826000 [compost metagenome]